mmetsp:Transcript_10406/g.21631  ORF Transcript_10406/g.21631 Transcript_10406/m.21631 type:complete len:81 (-) Transcript_10406:990-1232(-)
MTLIPFNLHEYTSITVASKFESTIFFFIKPLDKAITPSPYSFFVRQRCLWSKLSTSFSTIEAISFLSDWDFELDLGTGVS